MNISYAVGSDGIAGSPSVTSDSSPFSVTDTVYDAAGRVIWTDDPHAPTVIPDGTFTTYDPAGRVKSTARESNVVIAITTDPITGVITSALTSTTVLISATTSAYNAVGQLVSTTDARQHTTQYFYDADGRLTRTLYPDNTFTTTTYDSNGRKIASMDQAGAITNDTYDQYGNLTSVALPPVLNPQTGGLTRPTYEYAYDNYGNLKSEADPNDVARGTATKYTYDAYGRKVSETLPTLPDGTSPTEIWTYNGLGQLASTTDFDGHVINETYDDQGRVIEKDEYTDATAAQQGPSAASTIVIYTYDNYDVTTGRRYDTVTIADTAATNDNGETKTYYDTEGNIVEIDSPQGDISYTYNAATGQKTGVTTANTDIQYGYDLEGRLATVTVDRLDGQPVSPALVTTYHYDLNNNLVTTDFANGTVETRTYDKLNRLCSITTTLGVNGPLVVGYKYTLDADGRRIQELDLASGRTDNYTYDNDGRLTEEKITNDPGGNDQVYDYTYDLAGNRLTLSLVINAGSGTGEDLSYSYDADGRLTDVSGTINITAAYGGDWSVTQYTYDANGSTLTETTTINGTQTTQTTYGWDLEGRMISAVTTGTGAVTTSDTYDDSGNRTSETVNGQTTTYLNDPTQAYDQVLEEYTETGGNAVLAATYVRGLDLLFQDRTAAGGGTGRSFYAVDGLGSTLALTDASGSVTDTYTYDVDGNLIGQTWMGTTATPNEYLFAGYQRDTATGKDYLSSRYLDTVAGRFTSRDTIDGNTSEPITLNRYLYAGANPVDNVDRSGHDFSLGELALSIGVGAGIGGLVGGSITAVDTYFGGGSTLDILSAFTSGYVIGYKAGAFFGAIAYVLPCVAVGAINGYLLGSDWDATVNWIESAKTADQAYFRLFVSVLSVGLSLVPQCFVAGTEVLMAPPGGATTPSMVPFTKRIEDIQVGERVTGSNPQRKRDTSDRRAPDSESWRRIQLWALKPNGKRLDIVLLRPASWVSATGARTGSAVALDLTEMSVVGRAEVLSIESCGPILPGTGAVVTGTFAYEADGDLVNVFIEGLDKPIGCTASHPFWSEDRRDFVEAGRLQPGERVRTRVSGPVSVVAVKPRPGSEQVYNLEVWDEHVYEVSAFGVLVHNKCDPITEGELATLPNGSAILEALTKLRSGTLPFRKNYDNRPNRALGNTETPLPPAINEAEGITKVPQYTEYDVYDPVPGQPASNERIVYDYANDRVYYTGDAHGTDDFFYITDVQVK